MHFRDNNCKGTGLLYMAVDIKASVTLGKGHVELFALRMIIVLLLKLL